MGALLGNLRIKGKKKKKGRDELREERRKDIDLKFLQLLDKSCFDSYTLAQPLCDDNRSLYQTFNFKLFAVASTSGMYLVISGFSCEEPNNGLLTKSANL